MAGIILKALVSQEGPVPCQDRADNQRKALETKNFSSIGHHRLIPYSMAFTGYQSFSNHSGSRTAMSREGLHSW